MGSGYLGASFSPDLLAFGFVVDWRKGPPYAYVCYAKLSASLSIGPAKLFCGLFFRPDFMKGRHRGEN